MKSPLAKVKYAVHVLKDLSILTEDELQAEFVSATVAHVFSRRGKAGKAAHARLERVNEEKKRRQGNP